jgi:hypothetical protein
MFSEDDYRDLAKYLKVKAADLEKEGKDQSSGGILNHLGQLIPGQARQEMTDSERLVAAARQLEALRYNPMMVEALLEEYEVPMQVLEVSLLELPLHVNDPRVLSQTIVKWRFERGI